MSKYITLLEKQWDNERITIRYFIETSNITINSYYVNTESKRKYQENLKPILQQLKINGCSICGYNKCSRVLEFHHTNPEDKKFCVNICAMHRNDRAVVNELNKCILLCANCHGEVEE